MPVRDTAAIVCEAMTGGDNPISPTLSFETDGVHHGFLRLPHSRDESAWGSVMIPISVIQNGNGPTALLTGGNHGDEYEGPIALHDLAHTLDASEISGRVIIVPAFNFPAFQSARRTSPIDGGNLNRSFPGKADGTITEKIADYFNRTLVPMADVVLDFHSGGKTLDFIPFAAAHILSDKTLEAKCMEAMLAFNAPFSMKMLEIDNVGMYDTAVESQGKVFVTTELGGGGSATARSVAIAKKGIRNLLIHAGIMDAELVVEPSVLLDMPNEDCFVISTNQGLFEPSVDLGKHVKEGERIARIWPTERTGQPPIDYVAKQSGIMIGRHFPGLIKVGDCLAVTALVST